MVYKEFKRELHLTEQKPRTIVKTIVGIDFGHTNPAAVIPIEIDADNHYWIQDEWYKTQQTTEQIAQIALSYKSRECYADPAEPDRIQTLNRLGLNCREVSKDIVAGIDKVKELFKQGRIHINPKCVNLIWELETYHYPEKKPEQNEKEVPVKENDHALDALRYCLYTINPITKRVQPKRERPNYDGVKLRMTSY